MVKVIINGVEYTGNSVTVCDGDVVIDFKKVHGGALGNRSRCKR